MAKTLMFIGAGKYQVPGIKRAKELGLKVIAVDKDPKAPGFELADIPLTIDILDVPKCLEAAKKYKIDGVLTVASDLALPTVAALVEELRLPGVSRKVAEAVTNKAVMRERFKEHDVPSTRFFKVKTLEEAKAAVKKAGFPCVIKPVDNAGSRGVSKVDDMKGLETSFNTAKKYARTGVLLVEEWMEGTEVAADGFVIGGKAHVVTVSDKIRTPPPYLLDTTVIFPSGRPKKLQDKIRAVAAQGIKAVGLDNSPFHMELMVNDPHDDSVRIVEMAGRGAGFNVFTDIIPNISGIDFNEVLIRLTLGETVTLKAKKHEAAILLLIGGHKGVLRSCSGIEKVKALVGETNAEVYIKPGDEVRDLTSGSDRIAHIIAYDKTRQKALDKAEKAEKMLKFDIVSK
jgi:biotin carboxylase